MRNTPGRPTVRCYTNDLNTDWDSATHRAMAENDNVSVPVVDLKHPIVRKAKEDFPADSSGNDVARESISGLTNPVWWKVKIGARWRGAVWEDPDTGQAWLCAAGYRREGEGSDFYKAFMGAVQSGGPEQFMPTEADQERLADEQKEDVLERWERALAGQARAAATSLFSEGGGSAEINIISPQDDETPIATITVELLVEDLDDDPMLDVVVSTGCRDFSQLAFVQWAEMVALTAIEPHEQSWASLPVGGVSTVSLSAYGDEVDQLVASWGRSGPVGEVVMGDVAHYAHTSRLTQSTVEGRAVRSVCGTWFVPRQDHDVKEQCPYCAAVVRALPEG